MADSCEKGEHFNFQRAGLFKILAIPRASIVPAMANAQKSKICPPVRMPCLLRQITSVESREDKLKLMPQGFTTSVFNSQKHL